MYISIFVLKFIDASTFQRTLILRYINTINIASAKKLPW